MERANSRLEAAVAKMNAKAAKSVRGRVMDVQRPYLPMSEAMAFFGCKRDMLEGLRDNGKVRCSKVGRMLYFNVQDMERVWEERTLMLPWAFGFAAVVWSLWSGPSPSLQREVGDHDRNALCNSATRNETKNENDNEI